MEESMSEELRARVLADVNLEEESLKQGVQELRAWLSTIPYLPQQLDDVVLQSFLVSCKTLERARTKLHAAFTRRRVYPQYLADRNPFVDIPKEKCLRVAYLPGWTSLGQKIMLASLPDEGATSSFHYETSMRLVFMQVELLLRRLPVTAGHLYLLDASNISFALLRKLSIRQSKAAADCFFELFPLRFSGMILFNSPPITEFAFATFVKPFFPKKFKERVFIYRDDTRLHQHLPVEMLPQEYGGKAPSFDTIIASARKDLEENAEWLSSFGMVKEEELLQEKHHRSCQVM